MLLLLDDSRIFSFRLSFVTKDDHSGVPLVTLKIVTQSGEVKYKHRYTDTDLSVVFFYFILKLAKQTIDGFAF